LIEIIYAFLYGVSCPLVPEVAALEKKLISLCIVGGMLRHQRPLLAGQFHRQHAGHAF
jgi:hypothetical protein